MQEQSQEQKALKLARRILKGSQAHKLNTQKLARLKSQLKDDLSSIGLDLIEEHRPDGHLPKWIRTRLSTSESITYDYDVLKSALTPDVLKKLTAEPSIDNTKVQAAYELGIIEPEVLKRASTVRVSQSLSVSRVKSQVDTGLDIQDEK